MRNLVIILWLLAMAFAAGCEDPLVMPGTEAPRMQDQTRRANIWYFGDLAGLDFNNLDEAGRPTVLTDGALSTDEGSSVICDEDGNLLFYTDGMTVWNRLHEVMPNGTGLHGHFSSTQSALIVPQPASDRYHYIFTTDVQAEKKGLSYSIVDMEADNRLGDVTTKNIQLYTPTTEKLTAVHHANGRDIWVVTHKWESNEFYVYRVTEKGLNESPVVSQAGSVHEFDASNSNSTGQMKVSANGGLLALSILDNQLVEIFIFNRNSGQMTFVDEIKFKVDPNINVDIYGIEISLNEQYIYISESGPESFSGQRIFQYDVESAKVVSIDSVHIGGSIQLAPDGKIYTVNVDRLELVVIERPNLPVDHPDFTTSRMSIAPGKNLFGLPNFIQSYFYVPDPQIELPNVFTPNGDGANDRFEPKVFNHIEIFSIDLYDRTGNHVYRTTNPDTWWDGGNHPAGVYYWALQYEGVNGKAGSLKGWVKTCDN